MPVTGLRIDAIKVAPDNQDKYVHQCIYANVYKITQVVTCPLS